MVRFLRQLFWKQKKCFDSQVNNVFLSVFLKPNVILYEMYSIFNTMFRSCIILLNYIKIYNI